MSKTSGNGPATGRVALLAGATGLVGAALLERLLAAADYAQVHALARTPSLAAAAGLHQHLVDFDSLGQLDLGAPVDVAFCALGTTMRAAGSREAFERVDHDAIVAVAELAMRRHARRFVLVSSVGADPEARNFYLRVKGRTEAAVARLGFEAVDLLRPGLLLGRRRERRPLEQASGRIMRWLNPLLAGPLARYRAIEANEVAAAMIAATRLATRGVTVYEGTALTDLARSANAAAQR